MKERKSELLNGEEMDDEMWEWNENWGESWVGEPPVDYADQTKGQFLDAMERRLKLFMVRSVKACRSLSNDFDAQHFGYQLIRSSSSAAANFRAVRRSRSSREYFAKLSITIEELDESIFWLETLTLTELVPEHRLFDLIDEGYQLLKILSKSRKTASGERVIGERARERMVKE